MATERGASKLDLDARAAVLRVLADRVDVFAKAERALWEVGADQIAVHVHRYVEWTQDAYKAEFRNVKPAGLP